MGWLSLKIPARLAWKIDTALHSTDDNALNTTHTDGTPSFPPLNSASGPLDFPLFQKSTPNRMSLCVAPSVQDHAWVSFIFFQLRSTGTRMSENETSKKEDTHISLLAHNGPWLRIQNNPKVNVCWNVQVSCWIKCYVGCKRVRLFWLFISI